MRLHHHPRLPASKIVKRFCSGAMSFG